MESQRTTPSDPTPTRADVDTPSSRTPQPPSAPPPAAPTQPSAARTARTIKPGEPVTDEQIDELRRELQRQIGEDIPAYVTGPMRGVIIDAGMDLLTETLGRRSVADLTPWIAELVARAHTLGVDSTLAAIGATRNARGDQRDALALRAGSAPRWFTPNTDKLVPLSPGASREQREQRDRQVAELRIAQWPWFYADLILSGRTTSNLRRIAEEFRNQAAVLNPVALEPTVSLDPAPKREVLRCAECSTEGPASAFDDRGTLRCPKCQSNQVRVARAGGAA